MRRAASSSSAMRSHQMCKVNSCYRAPCFFLFISISSAACCCCCCCCTSLEVLAFTEWNPSSQMVKCGARCWQMRSVGRSKSCTRARWSIPHSIASDTHRRSGEKGKVFITSESAGLLGSCFAILNGQKWSVERLSHLINAAAVLLLT